MVLTRLVVMEIYSLRACVSLVQREQLRRVSF